MGFVIKRKYKPKTENVNKLKQYFAYITKTKKNNCNNIINSK